MTETPEEGPVELDNQDDGEDNISPDLEEDPEE